MERAVLVRRRKRFFETEQILVEYSRLSHVMDIERDVRHAREVRARRFSPGGDGQRHAQYRGGKQFHFALDATSARSGRFCFISSTISRGSNARSAMQSSSISPRKRSLRGPFMPRRQPSHTPSPIVV